MAESSITAEQRRALTMLAGSEPRWHRASAAKRRWRRRKLGAGQSWTTLIVEEIRAGEKLIAVAKCADYGDGTPSSGSEKYVSTEGLKPRMLRLAPFAPRRKRKRAHSLTAGSYRPRRPHDPEIAAHLDVEQSDLGRGQHTGGWCSTRLGSPCRPTGSMLGRPTKSTT